VSRLIPLGFVMALSLQWLAPPAVIQTKDLTCAQSLPGGWRNSTFYSGRWILGSGDTYSNNDWVCSYYGPNDTTVEIDVLWDDSGALQSAAALCTLALHGATPATGQAYVFSNTRAAAAIYGPSIPSAAFLADSVAALRLAAIALVAQAESLAVDCPKGGPAPITCTVEGTVSDALGEPIGGAPIELDWGQDHKASQAFTGPTGAFALPLPTTKAFDPYRDELSLSLTLAELHGRLIRFQLEYHGRPAKVQTLPFMAKNGCTQNLRLDAQAKGLFLSNPASPADLAQDGLLYVRTQQALNFAELMGVPLTTNLPLPIFTFCTGTDDPLGLCGGQSQSFFLANYPNQPVHQPYVALLPKDSTVSESDPPDGLYHELGHAVMEQAFGAIPLSPGSHPHAGFLNPTSTDSWVEGFADWFAVMVNKYVEKVGVPERLVLASSTIDIKSIHLATDPQMEEFAVAGVLLDLEDGPQDYPLGRPLPVSDQATVRIVQPKGMQGYVVGTIPTIQGSVGSVEVRVRLNNSQGQSLGLVGAWISPLVSDAQEQYFIVPIPTGVHPSKATIEEIRGRSSERVDTDGLNVGFGSLMAAILNYPNTGQAAHRAPSDPGWKAAPYVFNVTELYLAVKRAFGGRAVMSDGTDSVDRIFIAHGFYADLNGTERWQPGENIGSTDFVNQQRAIVARPSPGNPAIFMAQVDGPADAQVVVFVHFADATSGDDYSYLAPRDPSGRVSVAVPREKSQVSVMLIPPVGPPEITQMIDSSVFWAVASHASRPFLRLSATPQAAPATPQAILAGALTLAMWLAALGLVGLIALTSAGRVWRGLRRATDQPHQPRT